MVSVTTLADFSYFSADTGRLLEFSGYRLFTTIGAAENLP